MNSTPIDEYLANLKTRKDTLQLQLNEINTKMSSIRAHYSQARSNWIFKPSPHAKDRELRKLQPTKEKLQAEIQAVRAEITRMQGLKKQGIKLVNTK